MDEGTSYSWRAKDASRIRVNVKPSSIHPNVCQFAVDPPVYEGGAVHVDDGHNKEYSPPARTLLNLEGVTDVLIAGESVTVTTKRVPDWRDLGSTIAATIRGQIDSGVPSVTEQHRKDLPSSSEIRRRVQTLIDTAITPSVASHGGAIALLDVRDNNVYLEFGGGCQGCAMAHVTLKNGVERLIREQIPEVGQILDTTDHAGGTNPYYAPRS